MTHLTAVSLSLIQLHLSTLCQHPFDQLLAISTWISLVMLPKKREGPGKAKQIFLESMDGSFRFLEFPASHHSLRLSQK